MSEKSLKNNVALITGAGRGIGREIARAYACEGCAVVLISRTKREVDQMAEEIHSDFKVAAESYAIDVSDEKAVLGTIEATVAKFGKIDILVNAAGVINPIAPLEACDMAEWRLAFEVNLMGTVFMMRAVLPHMKRAHSGVIVNFSGAGEKPMPGFSAYASSKAAVVKCTEIIAEEARPFGISVNAVAPGPVNTKIFEDILAAGKDRVGEGQWEEFRRRKEDGGADVNKVSALALFLTSEKGRKISGKLLAAQWDDLERIADNADAIMNSDAYTMRRAKF